MIDTVHVGTCNILFCYRENKMIQIKKGGGGHEYDNRTIIPLYKDSC